MKVFLLLPLLALAARAIPTEVLDEENVEDGFEEDLDVDDGEEEGQAFFRPTFSFSPYYAYPLSQEYLYRYK